MRSSSQRDVREESAQGVPISITVYDQAKLDELNVVNASDLATYTPSLSVSARFGPEQSSFSIRGFTQELRTTASVAVYFADVVAPRGSGSVSAGDGAGPGAFFDLQNVLKDRKARCSGATPQPPCQGRSTVRGPTVTCGWTAKSRRAIHP
jgi:hypothetical protein